MRAEILSVGTEILVGSILNTNARYLAQKLAENALDVYHQTTVGDNVDRVIEALELAASRSGLLITTGGLGPTEDDITMKSVGIFLRQPLVFHADTYQRMQKRIRTARLKSNPMARRQCFVPKNSLVFINDRGTAPGVLCRFFRNGTPKYLIVLPGPPRELEPMFEKYALPAFFKEAGIKKEHFVVRSVKITGLSEVQVAQKVPLLLRAKPPVTTGIYAKTGGLVELRIMSKFSSIQKAGREADRVETVIRKKLGTAVFGTNSDTLSSAAGDLLRKNKMTLSLAESCTGGLLSSLITDIPGSSDYYLGGIIAYRNDVKERELGAPKETLRKKGAVSPEIALILATQVRKKFSSDLGIGITGIAGPAGGSSKKPVGLVYMALADKKGSRVHQFLFRGNRQEIKSRAAHKALDLLRLKLLALGRPKKR